MLAVAEAKAGDQKVVEQEKMVVKAKEREKRKKERKMGASLLIADDKLRHLQPGGRQKAEKLKTENLYCASKDSQFSDSIDSALPPPPPPTVLIWQSIKFLLINKN